MTEQHTVHDPRHDAMDPDYGPDPAGRGLGLLHARPTKPVMAEMISMWNFRMRTNADDFGPGPVDSVIPCSPRVREDHHVGHCPSVGRHHQGCLHSQQRGTA